MVINPIKTKSMTVSIRQKHQLSPYRSISFDKVSEHRLSGITIDNKLRWDPHTDNICKTVSGRVLFLSKWRYSVDIDQETVL